MAVLGRIFLRQSGPARSGKGWNHCVSGLMAVLFGYGNVSGSDCEATPPREVLILFFDSLV